MSADLRSNDDFWPKKVIRRKTPYPFDPTVGQVANYLPKKYSLSEHDFYSIFEEIFVFYLENFQNSQIFEVGADFQKILPKLSEKSHPPGNPVPIWGLKSHLSVVWKFALFSIVVLYYCWWGFRLFCNKNVNIAKLSNT